MECINVTWTTLIHSMSECMNRDGRHVPLTSDYSTINTLKTLQTQG